MRTFIFFLIVLFSFSAQAQESSRSNSPDNCEGNSFRLDAVRNKWKESQLLNEKGVIILVARLGKGESDNQLNQRRLYTASKYLNIAKANIVTGQGEKTDELGIVEVYVDGVLVESLTIKNCEDLRVGICDNDLEDNKRYQLPKPKRKIKCRQQK